MVQRHRHSLATWVLPAPPAPENPPAPKCRRAAWLSPYVQTALLIWAPTASALAQPQVTITGGPDESGQNYAWTVNHDSASPMVAVEFPHYMADICSGPEGWNMRLTNKLGRKGRAGVCSAESPEGLPRGASVVFSLRVGPRGAPRGEGDVVVRFSDGTEVKVRVAVPVKPSFLAGHTSLVGLGAMFVLLLLFRLRRRRKTDAPPAPSA